MLSMLLVLAMVWFDIWTPGQHNDFLLETGRTLPEVELFSESEILTKPDKR